MSVPKNNIRGDIIQNFGKLYESGEFNSKDVRTRIRIIIDDLTIITKLQLRKYFDPKRSNLEVSLEV